MECGKEMFFYAFIFPRDFKILTNELEEGIYSDLMFATSLALLGRSLHLQMTHAQKNVK